MDRSSTVIWQGSGKDGSGHISTQSKALEKAHYAYDTRFEDKKGTNPEELIAAAHASCYSMKLSFLLKDAGFTPDYIEAVSTVTLDVKEGKITKSHLEIKAKIDAITPDKFNEIAEDAKANCPVSKALNMEITMFAQLMDEHLNS